MVINKKNGKMYAEINRVEKLRFLSAMRTVVEFTIDIEAAEKNGISQSNKVLPDNETVGMIHGSDDEEDHNGFFEETAVVEYPE